MGFAREIYIGGSAGNLVAVMVDDGGTAHSYPVQQYQTISGKFITIKSSTTVRRMASSREPDQWEQRPKRRNLFV